MLPSSGYFQTLNCPFYDSGLCDRPYCHYRHAKKDLLAAKDSGSTGSITNSLSGQPGNPFIEIGDDENILEHLVSEAVKKALRDRELSSLENDISASNSGGNNSDVSTKLVEKVIEGLKPLVTPTAASSSRVPSYKPTPIAELRKRHIPVPYTPKDTKTIVVKRQVSCEVVNSFTKVNSSSNKHREEYVPVISGKANNVEVPIYKPSVSQKCGEVKYSPSSDSKKDDVVYTPSDKSSLSLKAADYVPTGSCDSFVSNTFYKPTTRGSSPVLEPEYWPDVESGSLTKYTYTPSKLDNVETERVTVANTETTDDDGVCSVSSYDSFKGGTLSPKGKLEKDVDFGCGNNDLKSVNDTNLKKNVKLLKENDQLNGKNKEISVRSSKEKRHKSSHSKYSSHYKERKEPKNHREDKDQKDSKYRRIDSKEELDSKNKEERKDSKNHKHSKESKEDVHGKDKFHESIRDSKEKRKRRDSGDHHSNSKIRHVHLREGSECDRKEKGLRLSCGDKNKSKTVHSEKSNKDEKLTSDRKNSHSRRSSHSGEKSKTKHKTGSVHNHGRKVKVNVLFVKKDKSDIVNSNPTKRKSDGGGHKRHIEKKSKSENSFEVMESLLKERIQERGANDDSSRDDSDTDEELRTQECLRIFNSYKPDEALSIEEQQKKIKVIENDKASATVVPPGRRRLAHDGTLHLTKKTTLPPKPVINPAQAMVRRFAKLREEQEKATFLSQSLSASSLQIKSQNGSVPGKVRIAHVPNVSKLLDAKRNLSAKVQLTTTEVTVPQSVQKGVKRVAHSPTVPISNRPFITPDDRSKIPTNVRQKYCNLIFEELLKKAIDPEECSRKSLEEEESCYQRSSTRNVYVNLAIITIQRLRNMTICEVTKDDSSGGSKSRVYHENVIGGKSKAMGLWSIIPPKKPPLAVDENTAYVLLQKYVLTDDELVKNGYPRPHPTEKGKAVMIETIFRSKTKSKSFAERVCDRCGKEYTVNIKGFQLSEEQCVYHWGRPFKARGFGGLETRYSCCQGEARSEGCCVWNCHVSDMFDPDKLKGFVQMLEKPNATSDQIFALDCEMCYTTDGLDLLRVTVVNFEGESVYDTLVKPEKPVLDYATRFSGICEEDMKDVTKTLLDVQATLLTMFDKGTILIGHSLDSDLKALKLIHDKVIDTSIVFPHRRGAPFKRALKTLCAEYLQKIIQNGEEGHDSAEDALACIELMKWKIKEDLKAK